MSFLRRFSSAPMRSRRPSTLPGERIYAIGDIHGRHDLLCRLLDAISAHDAALPRAEQVHLVFLGDVVDRGPDAAKAVALLHELAQPDDGPVFLLGNHEELMLAVLSGRLNALNAWLGLGGDATLRSYGVEPDGKGDLQLLADARAAIPPEHVAWMRQWPLSVESGDYFFCHAGIRPGVTIRSQAPSDLLWIRGEFLESEADHGAVVVHGHSVTTDVEMRPNRIGIDTGAYDSGILTALYLEGEAQEIVSVGP